MVIFCVSVRNQFIKGALYNNRAGRHWTGIEGVLFEITDKEMIVCNLSKEKLSNLEK